MNKNTAMGGRGEERALSVTGPACGCDHLRRHHVHSHGRTEVFPLSRRRMSER
jgi:hypothetical protein